MEYTVYALHEDCRVRYIGITKFDLDKRLKEHLKDSYPSYRTNWIKSMNKKGKEVIIKPIFTDLTKEEACQMEIYLIAKFRKEGFPLVNGTMGGEAVMAGRTHSQETKDKMTEDRMAEGNSFFGKQHSEESKKLMSDKAKLRPSPNKGKTFSDEHRKALSESHKGKETWNKGVTTFDVNKIMQLYNSGYNKSAIAKEINANRHTVAKLIKNFSGSSEVDK